MPNTASLAIHRPFEDPADTIAERNRKIVQSIAVAMFNRRLERLASAPGSVLLGGAMAIDDLDDAAMTTGVSLAAKDGEWKSALAAAEQEVRRATLHGFTAPELKEVMTNFMTAFETAAAQADTRRNPALADAIVATVTDEEFVTTPAWRLAQYQGVRADASRWRRSTPNIAACGPAARPSVFVSAKQPVGPAQAVAAVFAKSAAVATPARADTGATAFAYDSFGKPGHGRRRPAHRRRRRAHDPLRQQCPPQPQEDRLRTGPRPLRGAHGGRPARAAARQARARAADRTPPRRSAGRASSRSTICAS